MKLNKSSVIIIVLVLTAVAVMAAVPPMFAGNQEYEEHMTYARAFAEQGLCEKAMLAYEAAQDVEDSVELRVEMAQVYYNGLLNGEFTSEYDFIGFMCDIVDSYRNETVAYDTALTYLEKIGNKEDTVAILYQAEDLGIESEVIAQIRKNMGYMYEVSLQMYDDVAISPTGTFLVGGDGYRHLSENMGSVIGMTFDYATHILQGYALVKLEDQTYVVNSQNIRQAYFPNEITESTGIGDGLIACKDSKSYAYYDLNGQKLFGDYLYAGRFAQGVAAVQSNAGWQIIDLQGNPVSQQTFEDVKLNQSGGCADTGIILAKSNGKYALYDCQMNKISDKTFDDVDVFMESNGYAAAKVGGKWGYINNKGETVIEPKYEDARSFYNGLAGVKEGEYWSFITPDGITVIKGEFTDVNYFNAKGNCFVKFENYWSYISRYYNR